LLSRVGIVDPSSLESYREHGGYRALTRAIELGPDRVIAEVTAAKLLGRGGAAFPTGRKWDAVRRQPPGPRYLVCNADESEPGTFKDRILMEADPFAVLEAMTICGLATGAESGFIYIRGEYPVAEARMAAAIEAAGMAGLLGLNVSGSGARFDVEIRRGGGAYICGEETALFNSIEGKRGEPRSKPPFPAEHGVFGRPTVVNNVETLVNVLDIVMEGGEAWAKAGTAQSTGTRLFCLSGHVARPGVYEVPFGRTLRDLIEMAGGLHPGRTLQAVLLGGAAGTFVGPDQLDMPLTFEGVRTAGATLGSGVILVYDDTADLVDSLVRIAGFFRHESCGQCVPCRVGTVRQEELLTQLQRGDDVVPTLKELGQAMRDASICGLGQTASSAIETALAALPEFRVGGAR
jgi:NADH-quinone oxidoreductase subunit F